MRFIFPGGPRRSYHRSFGTRAGLSRISAICLLAAASSQWRHIVQYVASVGLNIQGCQASLSSPKWRLSWECGRIRTCIPIVLLFRFFYLRNCTGTPCYAFDYSDSPESAHIISYVSGAGALGYCLIASTIPPRTPCCYSFLI